MKPLGPDDIRGNWATLLLPVREDESIDYAVLSEEIDELIRAGVDGIYSNGTAGEFYTQSEEEYDRVNEMLAAACEAQGVPFQVGASHMSPQLSLERIRRAVRWRPSAIQVILSDWFPLQTEEAAACLQRMAEAADGIGLVLYNPPHAKKVLEPQAFAALKAAVPGLVGVKVADGDELWYEQMRRCAAGLSVFVPGHHLATGYRMGAAGAYSNVACLHPGAAQRWYELMKTEPDRALEWERRIRKFMDEYIAPFIVEQGYCNAACDKLLAAIGGWTGVGTRMRWPYRSIPQSEADRLRPIAQALLPEFFPE